MNKKLTTSKEKRERRKRRIRAIISGTKERPRLCVSRTLTSMYLQIIDDESGKTLLALHSKKHSSDPVEGKTKKVSEAYALGKTLAEKAMGMGIKKVIFDRSGFSYHGRVKAAAEGAREGGLEF